MKATAALLYIMRHAEAANCQGSDHERPLTEKGRQDSQRISCNFASKRLAIPQKLLVSSALRARQTAACLALTPAPEIHNSSRLYNGGYQNYLEEITIHAPEMGPMLLIGHNPSVLQLVHYLCKPLPCAPVLPAVFPTAGLAVIELSRPDYFCHAQSASLVDFITP